ncbi:MAG: OmpA family protein [Melioribacteraceae bacterium]|nr:MAG: OmpA family protein [Melioribacteraceae bacterium]
MAKKLIFLIISIMLIVPVNAQFLKELTQKVLEKTEDRANQKIDESIDKTLDAAEGSFDEDGNPIEEESAETNNQINVNSTQQQDFQTYSKFDFIPGEEVIFFDDFSDVPVGDFPLKWNTTASGEIVTVNNVPGKWLTLVEDYSYYSPEIGITYPENFTIEFDMIYPGNIEWLMELYVNNTDYISDAYYPGEGGISINALGEDIIIGNYSNRGEGELREVGKGVGPEINPGKIVRYSIWVQGQRLRIYVNENKVIDIPRALPKQFDENYLRICTLEKVLISNFRLAVGAPDTRSRLLTEGKLVTRGITFDSGSDVIKAESYGVIKEIADVLKENGSIRIKIVGHTDSDGADDMNLTLSKKRSTAVKNALANQFGIDASRIETDGKGESEPVSPNNTSEGKANNRRVEFIKLT